jgi:uncharacterized membrane protein
MSEPPQKPDDQAGKNPTSARPGDGTTGSALIVPSALIEALKQAGLDPSDPRFSRALEITSLSISGSTNFPPAVLLQQWEPLYPGITAKFVKWTEEQAAHRRSLEKQEFVRSQRRQDRAQFITAGAMYLGLVLSAIVGIFGHPFASAVLAIVSIGGPTAATALAHRVPQQSSPDRKQVRQRTRPREIVKEDPDSPA